MNHNPTTARSSDALADEPCASSVAAWGNRVLKEVETVFVGQSALARQVLIALLAGGHVLLESVPGLGKTLLVRALARVLGCDFRRIQFTPDLMPSDVTGSLVYDEKAGDFRFHPGPVFTQLLLADEINRAPAKTHAALLEVMEEQRVTTDGVGRVIEPPFIVLATQNPIESEGTYNLPEAQLDRFLFKLLIDYPDAAWETSILRLHARLGGLGQLVEGLRRVTSPGEVLEMRSRCEQVRVEDHVLEYVAELVRRTRSWPGLTLGASPRAGVSILRSGQAAAALEGRDYMLPDDVQDVALPALRHRVLLSPEAEIEGLSPDLILLDAIKSVEVPLR